MKILKLKNIKNIQFINLFFVIGEFIYILKVDLFTLFINIYIYIYIYIYINKENNK